MRKILLASAALVAFAGAASAADTATLGVTATINNNCDISTSGTVNISSGAGTGTVTLTCNYIGGVSGTITSQFGGLKGATNGVVYPYNVSATGIGSATSTQLAGSEDVLTGNVTQLVTNIPVNLTWNPAGKLADSYSDTLTVTVAP